MVCLQGLAGPRMEAKEIPIRTLFLCLAAVLAVELGTMVVGEEIDALLNVQGLESVDLSENPLNRKGLDEILPALIAEGATVVF